MIDRSRYFESTGKSRPCGHFKEMKHTIITLLKSHPEGVAVGEVTQVCGIKSTRLQQVLNSLGSTIPIGYDPSIDDRLYWVGL